MTSTALAVATLALYMAAAVCYGAVLFLDSSAAPGSSGATPLISAAIVSVRLARANGARPVSISNKIAPSA